MELKRKIASAIAAGALLLNAIATPAFASTTIELSGNGSNSNNTADVNITQNTTVVQSNNASITNNVSANAETGKNNANDNTGGDVEIDTGDATANVTVNNTVNKNVADVNCCNTGDTEVLISGNGTHSDNDVYLDKSNSTGVFQDNNAKVKNYVDVDAKTGKNNANDNTGGDVSIDTGKAKASADVSTTANVNSAQVGGNGSGGDLSLRILGNGSNSDNKIDLDLDNSALLEQSNRARVENYVDVDAKTGKNDANDNTGGDVEIDTGDATANAEVGNWLNFNVAEMDCGCLLDDITAKIAGNGTHSDNDIYADLGGEQKVFQSNCGKDNHEWEGWHHKKCSVKNDVDANAKTGNNDAKDNTGPVGDDPVTVDTGDADSNVEVSNSGNVNVLGNVDFDLPDFDFHFDFDLGDLLDLLGLLT